MGHRICRRAEIIIKVSRERKEGRKEVGGGEEEERISATSARLSLKLPMK